MVDIIRSKASQNRQKRTPVRVYKFGLEFYQGTTPEVHEFTAYPKLDAGSLNYILSSQRHPERALEGMVRSIRKMLADDDGTPVDYRPVIYQAPAPDDIADDDSDPFADESGPEGVDPEDVTPGLDDPDDVEPADDFEPSEDDLYVGVDGEPVDVATAQEAMRFENGSSRRRFNFLMDEDERLTLEADQLETIYKRLVGKGADRPTRR